MYFDLTDEQQAIKSTAHDFLASRFKSERIREIAAGEDGFDAAGLEEMAELGWTGLALPEEWGGQGLGIVELAVLFEEMGYALAPSPLFSNTVAGLALTICGSDDQRERYLRPLAAGERRGTPALWDAGSTATPGALQDGGEGRRRRRSSTARRSSSLTPPAPTSSSSPPPTGTATSSSATPPASTSSPSRRSTPPVASRRSRFDGVRVAAADTLPAAGHEYEPVFDRALRRPRRRVDRDRPADDGDGGRVRQRPPAVRPPDRRLPGRLPPLRADAAGDRERSLAVYGAAWAADAEPESLPLAASMAKAYASDAGWRVPDASIQVHGGIGFTWEHDLHFFLKRGRANAAMFGDAKWHRERVADAVLAGAAGPAAA